MRFPALTILALLWYLAVAFAIGRPGTTQPLPGVRDPRGFYAASVVTPPPAAAPAPDPAELALLVLERAERFTSGAVGPGGITPPEVLAWRVTAQQPDAEQRFARLVISQNGAAAAFGLAGMAYVAPGRLPIARRVIARRATTRVATLRGCVPGTETLGVLLEQLAAREWWPEYLGIDRPKPAT